MTSINPHTTFQYSQPSEYRFSHDSIFLARRVFEITPPAVVPTQRVLDLCSGCGIIGLDFLFHCQKEYQLSPLSMDFIEIQEIYRSHFLTNSERLGPTASKLQFLNLNYNCLAEKEFTQRYDLILCNPPYFFTDKGRLSPSEFKNRCRFFIDSTFRNLFLGIENTLKPGGKAYLLLRDLPEHRWHALSEVEKILQGTLRLDCLGDIRGTYFVSLTSINSMESKPLI